MAHFAEIDNNNIVIRVIVADDSKTEEEIQQKYKGVWKKASYNNNLRGQFAGVGYKYHATEDVFSPPKPYNSWTLGSDGTWVPPTAKPTDETSTMFYEWNEDNQVWDQVIVP